MNSQGYTKDNIHKGNTKIVAGGIDVDGLIRIGDQSTGGDGYVLPVVKGTEGQVITMNADNTSSFQDVGGDVASGRIIQNFFQMTNPRTAYSSTNFNPLYVNKNGSDIITTADIEVGSSVRFRTKGYLYNGTPGATALGQFRLRIGIPNTSSTFDFYSNNGLFIRDVGMSALDPNVGRGWWEINITITKVNASNACNVGVSGLYNCVASTGATSDTFDIQFYDDPTTFTTRLPNSSSSNTIVPIPFWSALPATFQVELAWQQTAFDANAIATEYTIDYLNVGQSVLATITAPATDHNTLANLNVGDPHQNYAILGGRSGGQILSGGITPANFLTLKSHTAGANNVIVKDLNTTFEKRIDMTQKLIENCSGFINPTAPTGIAGLACSVGESTTDMSMIFQSNQASIQQLANQIIRFEPSVITASKNLQIGTNKILDTLNNSIDFIGGDMTLLNTSLTNRIVIASQNEIDILANSQIKLGVPNASNNVVITGTDTSINQDLNMNSNEVQDVFRLTGSAGGLFMYSPAQMGLTAQTGNVDIQAVNTGSCIPLRVGGVAKLVVCNTDIRADVPLNMNSNNINNVNEITCNQINPVGTITTLTSDRIQINSGSAFNRIESDGVLILSGGGLASSDHINLDGTQVNILQNLNVFTATNHFNQPIIGVGSINGLSVIGGNSCGTSNSALLTASTTETSILPTTFIGSRQVPPNIFQQGDTFSATLAGSFGSQNGDTITIRLKGGAAGTTLLSSVIVPLNSSSASSFELDVQFSIRQTGVASVAEIVTNYDFTYNQSGGGGAFVGERNCEINSTTFDTSILNQLDITAQFSSSNANNSIQTFLSNLHKIY